jgi:hypothetical protein
MDHISKRGEKIIKEIYNVSGGSDKQAYQSLDNARREVLGKPLEHVKPVVIQNKLSRNEADSLYNILNTKIYIVPQDIPLENEKDIDNEFAAHYNKLFG